MSVRQRGEKWQADLTHKGQRYRELFNTKEEADEWEASSRVRILRGEDIKTGVKSVKADPMTIGELQRLTHRTYWAGGKSDKTMMITSMSSVDYFGPSKKVQDITSEDTLKFADYLKAGGNSGGTINRKMAALSKMLTMAKDMKVISDKPKIWRQRESDGRMRYYTPAEEAAFLNAFNFLGGYDERDLFTFLIDTGARLSEAERIRWADITDEAIFRETKNGSTRKVPLTSRVCKMLAERRQRLVDWSGPFSEMRRHGRLRGMWERARKMVGLDNDPEAVIHTLRHTFCSRLVQRGVPLEVVKDLAGHESYQTTLRYAHLAPGNRRDAINVLEESPVAGPNIYVVSGTR